MPHYVLLHNNTSEKGPNKGDNRYKKWRLGLGFDFTYFFVLRLVLVAGKGAGFTVENESLY
jgi:hypothetical protein